MFTIQSYIPSPCGSNLSFSRWWQCYKSLGSFPVYLASEVQKWSNALVPDQKLVTKVSKSHAIPLIVCPRGQLSVMATDKCIRTAQRIGYM